MQAESPVVSVTGKFMRSLRQEWHWALVLALPLLITLINPNWMYSPHALNNIDTWIYHGLFRHFFDFAAAQDTGIYYFVERLSWILPGYALYHIFPAQIANALLHLGVYYLAIFSLYGTARQLFGKDTALIAALCLGGYTWFLRAAGHDYLDGVGIAYYSAGIWFATKAAYQPRYKPYLFWCGVFLGLTIISQLFWAAFMPTVGLYYLLLNWKRHHHSLFVSVEWVGFGAVAVIALLMAFNFFTIGKADIFINSVVFIRSIASISDGVRQSVISGYGDIPATWLVWPCAVALCAAIRLARWGQASPDLRFILRALALAFCLTFAVFLYFHFRSTFPYLIIYLYMSLAIPVTFLLFAGVITTFNPTALTFRKAAAALGIGLLPTLLNVLTPSIEPLLRNAGVVWVLAGVAMAIMALALSRKASVLLLVGAFSVMSLAFSGHNGVAYHDRLRSYKIFMGADETVNAIIKHSPNLTDFTDLIVWDGASPAFAAYSKPLIGIYWGQMDWKKVQISPEQLHLERDGVLSVVMLSDDPEIVDKVIAALTGEFTVLQEDSFTLPGIDVAGQYRGYILTLTPVEAG